MSKKIGLDVDGTLLGFEEKFIQECSKNGINITSGKVWNFFDCDVRSYDVFNNLNIDFWLSLERIKQSIDLDIIPTAYISHRSFSTKVTKESLLKNEFPNSPVFHVKNTEDKVKVIKQLGIDIFVDDRASTVLFCLENGIEAYLLDQPWNEDYKCIPRIHTLGELNSICV